jgi:hypothetical protein
MYRIEVKPGEESVFRTIEELATAIRNGLVTPRSRIFHNASQKWLPIEFHPHYKKALQLPKTNSGETPAVKPPEPVKSQDSVKSPEPVKPVEPPKVVHQAPKPPESVTRTREIEIVYTPPVEARVPVAKPAPVVPPPAPAAPVRPAPVASAPLPKPAATQPPAPKAAKTVELPTIDYPETTAIESLIPVASASKARAASGRRRPMVLGTAVAVLIAGAYVGLSGAMPAHEAAADNGPIPDIAHTSAEPAHQLAVAPVAVSDSSIKVPVIKVPVVTAATSSTSPSFGPPSPRPAAPPAAAKRQIVTSIGATTPAAPRVTAKDSVQAIEPAPIDVDVSVPSAPSGDSLAPFARDSNGIGKILRAVSGKGGGSTRP